MEFNFTSDRIEFKPTDQEHQLLKYAAMQRLVKASASSLAIEPKAAWLLVWYVDYAGATAAAVSCLPIEIDHFAETVYEAQADLDGVQLECAHRMVESFSAAFDGFTLLKEVPKVPDFLPESFS